MQDQGKKLLIAVVLCLGVMLLWQKIFPPAKPPDEPQKGSAATTEPVKSQAGVATGETPTTPTSPTSPTSPATAQPPAPQVVLGPEQKIEFDYPEFHATFSSYGGALTSWKLKDERYQRDQTKGEMLGDEGAFKVNFWASRYVLPQKTEWKGEKVGANEVKYTYSSDVFDIVKDYTLVPDAFLVKLSVSVTMKLAAGQEVHEQLVVTSSARQDPAKAGGGSSRIQARAWQSSTLRDGSIVQTEVKDVITQPRFEANVQWTGFEHPFLLFAISPRPEQGKTAEKHTTATVGGLMTTDIVFQPADLFRADDRTPVKKDLVSYLGPKNYDELQHADESAGFSTGFKKTIDFGWFAFLGQPLLWLLKKFHEILGNWGLSIIVLTILVKLSTLYWMTKSMRSMKLMAAIAPEMKKVQEKWKGDQARLQKEMTALYAQYGMSPFSSLTGCLPMFLQMPIWIALYRMLSSAGELYQQAFIPGWIDDLTSTDPYYVLPVALMVTMFVQARLQPAPASTDSGQLMQQRLMKWGMPLGFGVFSFFFPSGLTIYMFTNTILSAVHSIYMNKFDKRSLEITAMIKKNQETAKVDDAKKAKDANPAKKSDDKAEKAEDKADDGEAQPVADDVRVRASQRRKKGGRRR